MGVEMRGRMDLHVDFVMVSYRRPYLLKRCLTSFFRNTRCVGRVIVVANAPDLETMQVLCEFRQKISNLLINARNEAVTCGVNLGMALQAVTNRFYSELAAPFICKFDDDIEFTPGWLEKLMEIYRVFSDLGVGFVSGHDAPEHKEQGSITREGITILRKKAIRGLQMLGSTSLWMKNLPIPHVGPNLMPGSHDWWVIRDGPQSAMRQGLDCYVRPGLIRHIGAAESGWLGRPHPEKESV